MEIDLIGNYAKHEQREMEELDPSWTTQLDYNGMQPHSREHLVYELNCARSQRKYEQIEGYMMDYREGIHFGDTP